MSVLMYEGGYSDCALCGTRRPDGALELANGEVSAIHDIGVRELVCSDREWCGRRRDERIRDRLGEVILAAAEGLTRIDRRLAGEAAAMTLELEPAPKRKRGRR